MFSKIRFVVLLLIICTVCKVSAQNNTVVKTDRGYIHGIIENKILVFKGIPYAAPPLGSLRFMPPVEHSFWADTLSATKFGSVATQTSGKKIIGSEDCLSLNIYTPKADNHKRAVVVWVHGGSMTSGSGKGMNGHAFADKDDIVTVTINYRLGAFGFLYLGDVNKRYAESGNCGVLDVIAALKWINKNISAFGGDPKRVTIMGESAGAKLISAVLVSPMSKGLFGQYIAESGSVQCIRDTITAKNERLRMLNRMGLGAHDAKKLLTMPADSIMKIQGIVCEGIGGNSFFGPVYDGKVIKQDGYKYAASTNLPKIKALIGTNEYEGALFFNPNEDLDKDNGAYLKSLFGGDYPMVYAKYHQQLKTDSPYAAGVKVLTQYMYQMHSYRFAKVLAQNNIPVWMYRFKFDDGKPFGAKHAWELQYIWNTRDINTITDSAKKQLTINMHGAWVAFIKTGNPNISSLPQWPKYNNVNRQIMVFDTIDKVISLKEVYDDKNFPSQVFMLK
ncbi:MAG: carboxylesterase/lipase family protein [Sphingobacteriales bacterium]